MLRVFEVKGILVKTSEIKLVQYKTFNVKSFNIAVVSQKKFIVIPVMKSFVRLSFVDYEEYVDFHFSVFIFTTETV